MARPIRPPDLVARALGVLPAEERDRVDRALASDPALRQRFEQIAGHLLQYDSLPPPPPPPPFARLAAALDDDAAPDLAVLRLSAARPGRRRSGRLRVGLGAAAAVALLALGVGLLLQATASRSGGPALAIVPGRGLEVVRAGRPLPAPPGGARPVQRGDRLLCEAPAEARYGERLYLVLDAGARLRVEAAQAVTLEAGRAFFEVDPGPAFTVHTPKGDVEVVGTVFEVDLRGDTLGVAVDEGHVRAAGHEIRAGARLEDGRLLTSGAAPARYALGAWFRRPQLDLEAVRVPLAPDATTPVGQPLMLRLLFRNPGNLPVRIVGPGTARTPVWIGFESAQGDLLGELPVLSANVVDGGEILRPGGAVELAAGAEAALTVRILPPFGSPGAYRCKALYRPEDQPAVLSSSLEIEVR